MYYLKKEEVLKRLKTSQSGLSEEEAAKRIEEYGLNEIPRKKRFSALKILLKQFADPLVLILIVAVVISGLLGEFLDAVAIIIIVVINSAVGFGQEYKAEKAIELLRRLRAYKTVVMREGREKQILTKELVPGDIIILEEGDKVPADAILLKSVSLHVDESSLTGESVSVVKNTHPVAEGSAIADRTNMVFSGTVITGGRAEAVVVSTGTSTEIGKIAVMVKEIDDSKTPLQKKLKHLGTWITYIIIFISVIILAAGLMEHLKLMDAFLISVSLAVSAIPEGLPAVVTIVLALGLRRMLKRKALIRRLKAVETLGSVTVIASDKTGTITKNEMTVTQIYSNDKFIAVTGKGYKAKGDFLYKGRKVSKKEIEKLLTAAASCTNAVIGIGDPTEIALIVMAAKAGIKKDNNRIGEVPFDSNRKYMATMHKNGLTYVKGAPEKVLQMCSYIELSGRKRRLTKRDIEKIEQANNNMAEGALRVLAVAYGSNKVKNLVFLGLVGMIDPPRDGVKEAIRLCNTAGIRTIMITGDHKVTAEAIAKKVGIAGKAVEGKELDKLSDKKMREWVKRCNIYARVSSEHKVKILSALQENGEIVAMTGDGVNDAPALKKADVGVAMNIKGTDVSRDVSDIILMDDNFVSIVSAVREGRVIYDNIRKFIKFLLSSNFDEVALILFAILSKLPLPLLPIQLLWVNLITDSTPALALGVDPPDKDIMRRRPRPPKQSIFYKMKYFLVVATLISLAASLSAYFAGFFTRPIEETRTIVLTTVVMFELFLVLTCRSDDRPLYKVGFFTNKKLLWAVALSLAFHLIAIYSPLSTLLKVSPLTLADWGIIIPLALSGLVFFEIRKIVRYLRARKQVSS